MKKKVFENVDFQIQYQISRRSAVLACEKEAVGKISAAWSLLLSSSFSSLFRSYTDSVSKEMPLIFEAEEPGNRGRRKKNLFVKKRLVLRDMI